MSKSRRELDIELAAATEDFHDAKTNEERDEAAKRAEKAFQLLCEMDD